MLETPQLPMDALAAMLHRDYGVAVNDIAFLPLGADVNTAVFEVSAGAARYFLKLRSGPFDDASLHVPALLCAQGNPHIIPIIGTSAGALRSRFERFATILQPFVEGRDGFNVTLSPAQWRDFGAAFRHLHTAEVPSALLDRIPVETYSPAARNAVAGILAKHAASPLPAGERAGVGDEISREVIALLRHHREVITDLVARASRLAQVLQTQRPAVVVCHGDIHAGNILVDSHDHLFIVDWDTLIRAPRERDLMFFGGGQGFKGYAAGEERALFFAGYGDAAINEAALAYYRYERIVQDIHAFCAELLAGEGEGENRRQSLRWLAANFDAGGVIDVAFASDRSGI
jgi:spectinomycin phosphotransferase